MKCQCGGELRIGTNTWAEYELNENNEMVGPYWEATEYYQIFCNTCDFIEEAGTVYDIVDGKLIKL